MVRFTVDNRNRLIFYGNPVGYVKADTAVVDEMFRTDELNQYLNRMNLTPRWEVKIYIRQQYLNFLAVLSARLLQCRNSVF